MDWKESELENDDLRGKVVLMQEMAGVGNPMVLAPLFLRLDEILQEEFLGELDIIPFRPLQSMFRPLTFQM